jgi:quercetin dioxygenase-like cupin family protein
MSDGFIIEIDDIRIVERGGGIRTQPLVIPSRFAGARITSGMTVFPPGKGAPMHSHNCDEQVTLMEGMGEVEIDGRITAIKQYDTTYIPADLPHRFENTGDGPMRILWIYTTDHVTRTFTDTGETVEHLSGADLMSSDES